MTAIPQKELRNNSAAVLRRAEGGERFAITVSGRPVAELGPLRPRVWVSAADAADIWARPVDADLGRDLAGLRAELRDPWS